VDKELDFRGERSRPREGCGGTPTPWSSMDSVLQQPMLSYDGLAFLRDEAEDLLLFL
jgi:hypothetical protein